MKITYFLFLSLLVFCLEARKLNKACPLTPVTATTTTTPKTTTTTPTTTTTTPTTTTTTTTTTPTTTKTTTSSSKLYGVWVLTEDNTVPTPAGWYPKVRSTYPFNTYWLSFLNPNTIFVNGAAMNPSSAFTQFSMNRDVVGGPKSTDKVLYSIGGYSYSQPDQTWSMFDNNANAKVFAQAVVNWKKNYKMDGFDLDWESAFSSATQIAAVYTFITTVKALDPTLLITIEEAGYPQFTAALVIQYANANGLLKTLLDSVDYFNVMYYSVDSSQNSVYWVKNSWQKDCTNWCALGTTIPSSKIILGVPGCCDQASIQSTLKSELCTVGNDNQAFGGYMTWYISSDSTPNIVYGGVCTGSEGCQLSPANAAYFATPSC